MKNKTLFFILIISFIVGCKGKGSNTPDTKNNDSSRYFQIAVIFEKDLKEIEATPYYMYKIEKTDSKTDSTPINKEILKQIATQFFKPDISTDELKQKYKESIFEDQTTGGITINYSTLDKGLEIQSEDILMKNDGKTIKNIFIRKFFQYGNDSSAIEQLSWKPGERFQIVRSVQKKDKTETNHQTLVVWNDKTK